MSQIYFWWTLQVSDRSTVHHQESQHCIHSSRYLKNCFVMYVWLSARMYINSAPTGRILVKFGLWAFFEHLSVKSEFHYSVTRLTGTLHKDLCTCVKSRCIPLRTRSVSDKSCRENQNTHFVLSFFPTIVTFMRKCGNNTVEPERPQLTTRCTRFARWITKATNTQPNNTWFQRRWPDLKQILEAPSTQA
jgi:hypothetical protein